MKILVIIGHQQKGSFCHAIAATAIETLRQAGHEVVCHDLYEERFDPVLPAAEVPRDATLDPVIQRHCDELLAADGYLIVHPNWWGTPPAILKGWLDRVVRQGTAYKFGPQGVIGLLAGRRAMVFTTSNTPRDIELSVFNDPLENFWKTVVFAFVGVNRFERRNFEPIILSTPEQRQGWLKEVQERVGEFFQI
jgi:putative NADPH-quinone reductase